MKHVFVWTLHDVIGLVFLAIFGLAMFVCLIMALKDAKRRK